MMFNPVFNSYGFGVNNNCGCKPEVMNFYKSPAPVAKPQKILDVKQVTIHTDKNISRGLVRGACCEPEEVVVKESKKSLIFTACTDCLKPGEYYTLNILRETPIEAFSYDVYINVEPDSFNSFRGEVGLVYTEVDHCDKVPQPMFDNMKDNLESVEIDGQNSYINGGETWGGFEHNGPIPSDPAFPSTGYYGCGFRTNRGVLIPVSLDLHGNIATGRNFATGKDKNPGTGAPYSNKFVLYLNNQGQFVLSRSFRRRSDFA